MIADGHIHTPFCPHGTNDSFEDYIKRAISLGIKEITFTEHAPLPDNFEDPTPTKDSAMKLEDLAKYFETITKLQEEYKASIKINRGLEVDYIEDYETEITDFLNKFGKYMDDSILSVHFLKMNSNFYCLDYSDIGFHEMIDIFGSVENIYSHYYDAVLKSIRSNLGLFKPKRIGHITLVHKFQKKYPVQHRYEQELKLILNEMLQYNLQIDYNGAGIKKPLCNEAYPPDWVIKEAMNLNIPIIYGSDAHQAKDLNQGLHSLEKSVTFSSPSS